MKRKTDYAKWLLEDPRVNFAISRARRKMVSITLVFRSRKESELTELRERLKAGADMAVVEEGETVCCSPGRTSLG